MKTKKSLGQIAYDEAYKHIPELNGKAWTKIANSVAREVRKRDNEKYEKIRQLARRNAVSVSGN